MTGKARVLVTGGAGFIGSHLCRRLLGEGYSVVCVDNFSSSTRENLLQLLDNSDFELVKHDVTLPLDIEVDQIYSLATPASPVHYQRAPVDTILTSVAGSFNMLTLARRTGARILLASTSEVYGDPTEHPQSEDYWGNVNPTGVRSCYVEGKRCSESLFFAFWRQYGTVIKIARIFNTYGPNMHPSDGRVVPNFVIQALSGQSITVFGSGCQTRSFTYIDDLIEGLMRLMNSPADVTGPINLGSTTEITIAELAERVMAAAGSGGPIEYLPEIMDDPIRRRPDLRKARDLLGWTPQVPLSVGLSNTVGYFTQLLSQRLDKPIHREALPCLTDERSP